MLAKRIIPCLDIENGRVVKGTKFVDIVDAGDPISVAKKYNDAGADEICFLDISASQEKRRATLDMIEKVASEVFIPLTVGGGIKNIADIRAVLNKGADKVSINTAAILDPEFVKEAADYFGNQCIVVAVDAKRVGDSWEIFTHGGRNATGIDAIAWAEKMAAFGAGELLVTSMDRDGTKAGFDNELIQLISRRTSVPVIASGGVGDLQHLVDGVLLGEADAVLAASIFHFGTYTIKEAKDFMRQAGITVRV